MLSKKGFFAFFCIFLWPLLVCAKNDPTLFQYCIFLGSNPSLIVKFRNISSHEYPNLKPQFIHGLSSSKATFLSGKAMSGDAYIVFFLPGKSMRATQIRPGCYSQSSINELVETLKTNTVIEYVDPNLLMTVAQSKKSFMIPIIDPIQWNLLTPPGGIDAQTAFNITTGNSSAITAVLDTGILLNDSLTPNVLPGVTFNNNGSYATGATPSCDSSCDEYDHGTHVAGIVSASGILAYSQSIYGVAPTSKVLPINVFTKINDPIDCGGSAPCLLFYTSDLINAGNWLNGTNFIGLPSAPYVTTVNMSLGATTGLPCGSSSQAVINQLIIKNISIAVSAGNGTNNDGIPIDASNQNPANCIGVMPIAATGPDGYGAFYSNYGNIISFAAPGGNDPTFSSPTDEIYSTIEAPPGYGYKQGTSMAAPHVAGLSTLLYSIDPTLTPANILNIIQTTTTPFPAGGPGDSCTITKPCGTGIINAAAAVTAAVSQTPILTWADNLTITQNSITQVTVSWNAATWSPTRTTSIIYTVNINGSDVSTCSGITSQSCVLTNLTPNRNYTVYVKATDYRNIYTPIQTPSKQFILSIIPPSLTVSARNPLKPSMAYIYYDSLGNPIADSYAIDGLPNGATLMLDTTKNRFVVFNITTPKKVEHVTIIGNYLGVLTKSNEITIPSIL